MNMVNSAKGLILSGVVAVAIALNGMAASGSWTGDTDGEWSVGSNWSGGTPPGAGEQAIFDGSGNGNTVVDIGSGVTIKQFDVLADAAAYTFNGSGGLAVSETINLSPTAVQTFNVPFQVPYIQSYNLQNNGSAPIIFNSTYGFSSTRRGNFSGTGDIYLNGGTKNVEWCLKDGPNTLNIRGKVQFQFEMLFNEGVVNYNATNDNSTTYAWFVVGNAANKKAVFNLENGVLTRQLDHRNAVAWGGRYYPAVLGWEAGSTGIVNHITGTFNNFGHMKIGCGNSSLGEYNISDGILVCDDMCVGFSGSDTLGKFNMSGGEILVGKNGPRLVRVGELNSARGEITISGGVLKLLNSTSIRLTSGASTGGGLINQSGGEVAFYSDIGTMLGGTGVLDMRYSGTQSCDTEYNLSGGVLAVPKITSSTAGGTRTFNFDGGTLRALVNEGNWVNLNSTASSRINIRDGGALFDTNGREVGITQPLLHSNVDGDSAVDGGVVKSGEGVLRLSGVNTFTGPVVVSEGILDVSGSGTVNSSSGITVNGGEARYLHTSSVDGAVGIEVVEGSLDGVGGVGSVSVADNADNLVTHGNGGVDALSVATLTFDGAATIDLRSYGSEVGLEVEGELTTTPANGVVTINIVTEPVAWESGSSYRLIKFDSFSGSADDFAVGSTPGLGARQSAVIVVDSLNGYLVLEVSGDSPYWSGESSGEWTTSAVADPKNWRMIVAGTATDFVAGDSVHFDDRATGSLNVNLAEDVAPTAMFFNNTLNDYVVASSGGYGITSGYLTKDGSGMVTLLTDNSYKGATTIVDGTLQIGDGTVDGELDSASEIINGATLIYNVAVNQSAGNQISGSGKVVKRGSGALSLSGNNTLSGDVELEAGQLNINSSSALGNTSAGTLIVSGGTVVDNTSGTEVISVAAKQQVWAGDFVFDGSSDLSFNGGAVALTGEGVCEVEVAAGKLSVGSISSSATGLKKSGSGTLTAGSVVSTLGGPLEMTAGTLQIGQNDFRAAGLSGTGTIENDSNTDRWFISAGSGSSTFAGLLQDGDGSGRFGICQDGGGTLTLTGLNTYSHRTCVRGNGTLIVSMLANVGEPCNVGMGTIDGALRIGDGNSSGVFRYTGPDVVTDRGYTLNAAKNYRGTIETDSNLTFTGKAEAVVASAFVKLGRGTLTLANGSSDQRVNFGENALPVRGVNVARGKLRLKNGYFKVTGETIVGGQITSDGGYQPGAMDIMDGAGYRSDTWFSIGRGNGNSGLFSVVTLKDGTIDAKDTALGYQANPRVSGFNARPNMTLRGSSQYNGTGNFILAESDGAVAVVSVQDQAKLNLTIATRANKMIGIAGVGTLNVAGGEVNAGNGLILASASAGTGIINLNGGVLKAGRLERGSGAKAELNFSGGVLQANANESEFLKGLSAVRVYAGGAVIDAQEYSVGVALPLQGVVGNGVTGVSEIDDESVYVITPEVVFSGPEGGSDVATGYALLYDDGTLEGVVLSHAGSGYEAAPTLSLNGVVVDATVVLGSMAGGGVMFRGSSGTNMVSGVSSYTGATVVEGGTLMLRGGLASSGITVESGAVLAGYGSAVDADVVVESGGVIAPAADAGNEMELGSLTLEAGAGYGVEFFADGKCAQVSVAGELAVDGLSASDLVIDAPENIKGGSHVLVSAATVSGELGSEVELVLVSKKKWGKLVLDSNKLMLQVRGGGTMIVVK